MTEQEIPIREIEPHPCRIEAVASYVKLLRAGHEPPPITELIAFKKEQAINPTAETFP